jgi:hypothetical protein
MIAHKTTACSRHSHREFTIQLAERSPIPDIHRLLIEYFEESVARGTKFLPGQTVLLGWAQLKLCDRRDGTIGVQERELSPDEQWVETVDRALNDTWFQKEIVASVGLLDELSFPRQFEDVIVTDCALNANDLLALRLANDRLPEGFSGWSLTCAEDHDHGEKQVIPLLAVAATLPAMVQLLALPHDTVVLVAFREKPDAPPGMLRIEPHVFRHGEELVPKPGSYLAALQG